MRKTSILIAFLPALIVFLGVWRVDYGLRVEQQAQARAEFEANVARAGEVLDSRITKILNFLGDTGNVVAQTHFDRGNVVGTFDRLVAGRNALDRFPELDGIGFVGYVATEDAEALAAETNRDPDRWLGRHGDMRIRPETSFAYRAPVMFIHPLDRLRANAGVDLMTTNRRDALIRAIASRGPAATGKIRILGDRPGVVVFYPVYRDRTEWMPFGFMGAGFATDLMLANQSAFLDPLGLDIAIYDIGLDPNDYYRLDQKTPLATRTLSDGTLGPVLEDPRVEKAVVRVGDHHWAVYARPAVPAAPAPWVPNWNVALGGVFALLIAGVIRLAQRDAATLATLVDERTRELQDAATELETRGKEAQYQAVHDDLTGLANRRGFEHGLDRLMEDGAVVMYSFDVDGFKAINDSRGHAVGDLVLKAIAEKLEALWHHMPGAIVARLSGDEFVVATPLRRAAASDANISLFLEWTSRPLKIDGQEIRVGASVGRATSEVSGQNASQLLADADLALYRAKAQGKNQMVACTVALRAEHNANYSLGEDLLKAFDRDEIEPFFQTQHAAEDGRIVGAEVLARWCHPELGVLAPHTFLTLAENLGVMHELDARIMCKAIEYSRELEMSGIALPKLNVNVSAARLADPRMQSHIAQLPEMETKLVFEIVESVFLDDRSSFEAWHLDFVREKGIGVELDDFGTGHASVVALTTLRPDRLKLDRSFIQPLPDEDHEALVRSIVDMGAALGIPTTAEGVETIEQAERAAACGVDTFQGYLYSKPIAFNDLLRRLDQQAA